MMSSSFMLEVDFCSWHNWQQSAVIYLITDMLSQTSRNGSPGRKSVSVAVSN